jgi:hypothetical protein
MKLKTFCCCRTLYTKSSKLSAKEFLTEAQNIQEINSGKVEKKKVKLP